MHDYLCPVCGSGPWDTSCKPPAQTISDTEYEFVSCWADNGMEGKDCPMMAAQPESKPGEIRTFIVRAKVQSDSRGTIWEQDGR